MKNSRESLAGEAYVIVRERTGGIEPPRHPHVGGSAHRLSAIRGQLQSRSEHADHLHRLVAESNGLADDPRVAAELASPEIMGQHDHGRGAGAVIVPIDDSSRAHHGERAKWAANSSRWGKTS